MERYERYGRLAAWAVGLLAAAWVLGRFSTLVVMTVVVVIVTFPIYPVVGWLERRSRLSRGIAAAITLIGLLVVVGLGVLIVVPWIVSQTQLLVNIAPKGIETVSRWLADLQQRVSEPTFPLVLRTAWERGTEAAVGAANAAVTHLVNRVVGWFGQLYLVLLLPFIIYFVLLDYSETRASVLSLISEPMRSRIERLLAKLTTTLRWGLWAQVVVSSIVGTLTAVGLAMAGVPGVIAIGAFAAVAEAIPYIGGFATYVVALLAAAPEGGAVWLWALLVVTIVKLLSNLLVPLVLGRMTHTHPLAIIAALLALGQLFGLLGMFFAIPVVVIAREVIAWWRESTVIRAAEPVSLEPASIGPAPPKSSPRDARVG